MSWKGFTKAINRAGTTVMQKTGQIERTDDPEFDEFTSVTKGMEKQVQTLQREAKTYLDAVRNMASSQSRIADGCELFFNDTNESAVAANAYRRAADEYDNELAEQVDATYRATVLDPISKMVSYFPEVNKNIEKRNKKLLDYDAARSRYKKVMDKGHDDPTKLPRAEKELEDTKLLFETLDDQLKQELPQLRGLRVPYLDPSFEAMIRVQAKVAELGYEKLGGVQRYFDERVRDDYAGGVLDEQVEGVLNEMRALSIVGISTGE